MILYGYKYEEIVMSIKSAEEFLKKTTTDVDFLNHYNTLEYTDQKDIFLNENGFNFTKEELKEVKSELNDEDLDSVAGGGYIGHARGKIL